MQALTQTGGRPGLLPEENRERLKVWYEGLDREFGKEPERGDRVLSTQLSTQQVVGARNRAALRMTNQSYGLF